MHSCCHCIKTKQNVYNNFICCVTTWVANAYNDKLEKRTFFFCKDQIHISNTYRRHDNKWHKHVDINNNFSHSNLTLSALFKFLVFDILKTILILDKFCTVNLLVSKQLSCLPLCSCFYLAECNSHTKIKELQDQV